MQERKDREFGPAGRVEFPAWGWRDVGLPAVILLLTLAVYGSVGGHGFLRYDDDLYVTANDLVKNGFRLDAWISSWTTNQASNWHPATWWSHMLDVELFGLAPAGHHWMNVVWHGATAVLLYSFFRLATGAIWRSAFVAAVFALHPLHVQSVAWVAERKDVLSAFFWALTLLAYHRYSVRPNSLRYLGVLFAFGLGLLAKPMLVTLPFLLLLLDRWPLGRSEPLGQRIREKLPFFALAAASALVTFLVQSSSGAVRSIPLGVRFGNAIVSYFRYLGRTFWPDGLAVFYPYPREVAPGIVLGGAILLLGLSLLSIREWHRRPWIPVGWFWYLGTLVPVIGLVQVGGQAMADRYTYVPMIGVTVLVAWGVAWLVESAGRAGRRNSPLAWTAGGVLGAAVLLLALAAHSEVRYWRDDETLFTRALAVTRENYVAHGMLGVARAEAGDLAAALTQEQEAVRIQPDWAIGQKNLGKVLYMLGRPAEAETPYREALRLAPSAVAHVDLASALLAQGKVGPAIEEYRRAVTLDPGFAEAYSSLGTAYTMSGQFDLAFQNYERALALDPEYVDAYVNYGITLQHVGRVTEAVAAFRAALARNPEHPLALSRLEALTGAEGTQTR